MQRLPFKKADDLNRLRLRYAEQIEEDSSLIQEQPGFLFSGRYSSLKSAYYYAGVVAYALGEDLGVVAAHFRGAVQAHLQVLEFRGSDPAFETYTVTLRDGVPIAPLTRVGSPDNMDWSCGSSAETYEYCAVAFLTGDVAAAEWMAKRIWDPKDASHVNWSKYSLCNPNRQAIAYAFQSLMAGSPDACKEQFRRIAPLKLTKYQHAEATCLKRLADGDSKFFKEALGNMIDLHTARAKREKDLDLYISRPAVNFAMLGLRQNLITVGDLPSSPFLPIEMLPS